MIFSRKRKKSERPKSVLGDALFRFDNIYGKILKNIINPIKEKKRLNQKKADILVQDATDDLDSILEDISKDNFKTDYRSDKIRDTVINMIDILKETLHKFKSLGYDAEKIEEQNLLKEVDKIDEKHQQIEEKMKEIGSDYQEYGIKKV